MSDSLCLHLPILFAHIITREPVDEVPLVELVARLKVLVVSKLGKHSWMKAVLGSFPFSERYSVNFSAVP